MTPPAKKVLYLITEDWYFCSHRLALARGAKGRGYDVTVATRVSKHKDEIEREGFRLYPLKYMRRSSMNPFNELKAVWEVWRIYRKVRPDIVHHVALKPVLYGSLVAKWCRTSRIINTLSGLGHLFISASRKAILLRNMFRNFCRRLFRRENSTLIVQNYDDLQLWQNDNHIPAARLSLIKGSGVDTRRFTVIPEPEGQCTIVYAGRMLWDKGIGDLVAAVQILRSQSVQFRLLLCGPLDPENPSAIAETKLKEWENKGILEWCGQVDDMAKVYQKANIVVLPSYREGLPKVLLEAAACARAIVATDVPGCREIVENNVNGLLVPVHNPNALAAGVAHLIRHPELRKNYGAVGREKVLCEFADEIVVEQTLNLYS